MIPVFNLKTIRTKLLRPRKSWSLLRQAAPVPLNPPMALVEMEYIVRVMADILWTPILNRWEPSDFDPSDDLPDAVTRWANNVMTHSHVLGPDWGWEEAQGSPDQVQWNAITVPEWTFHGVGLISAQEAQKVLDALQNQQEYQHQFMGANYVLFLYFPDGEERVEDFEDIQKGDTDPRSTGVY